MGPQGEGGGRGPGGVLHDAGVGLRVVVKRGKENGQAGSDRIDHD